MNKEEKETFLKNKFDQIMTNHICGNYITIDIDDVQDEVEWFTNYDTEKFVALTEYGTYSHQYDWDYDYDTNLNSFVEDLINFIINEKGKESIEEGGNNGTTRI